MVLSWLAVAISFSLGEYLTTLISFSWAYTVLITQLPFWMIYGLESFFVQLPELYGFITAHRTKLVKCAGRNGHRWKGFLVTRVISFQRKTAIFEGIKLDGIVLGPRDEVFISHIRAHNGVCMVLQKVNAFVINSKKCTSLYFCHTLSIHLNWWPWWSYAWTKGKILNP